MSYVTKILQPGENLLVVATMHWIVYAQGAALTIAGLIFALWPGLGPEYRLALNIVGGLVAVFGLVVLIRAWFDKWTTEIAVTDKRVIHKRGFISRSTAEMNMDKVESVTVDQSLLGRLLGYGSVVIRGTGAGLEGLHHIANPLALRSAIVVR